MPVIERTRVTIYLDDGLTPGTYVARAYDDDTEEVVCSTPEMPSVAEALRKVAEGIERRAR